jgi:DNA primase
VRFLASYIPDDKIEEIKNAADIVDIISESVALKKTGKNFQGLCPFHAEKTPSFSVDPSKQIFHCFGCGVGGDVFSFLMQKEGMTFMEVVKDLSNRYGVSLPTEKLTANQKRKMNERDQLLKINKLVNSFFKQNLHNPKWKASQHYLAKRGLTPEIVNTFELGFAPSGWTALYDFLKNKRVPSELIEKSGLVKPGKKGKGYYDTFRNRIVFPILNTGRQIIGFGGRVMDDGMPKYLNSPETPIYNKRRSLYGINLAKQSARKNEAVYVVEGYFDAIALYQHGIQNTVATCGTALTSSHVKMLKGLVGKSGRVFLVFDSDTAGIRAAERSIDVFAEEYMDVYILTLPEGHDPDSYVFEFGSEAFAKLSADSKDTITFLMEMAIQKHGLSLDGRIRIVSELGNTLAAIDDPVAKSVYIRTLSERIGIDEGAIFEKIKSTPSKSKATQKYPSGSKVDTVKNGLTYTMSKQSRIEQKMVAMMFQFPRVIPEMKDRGLVDVFDNKELKTIGKLIIKQIDFNKNPIDALNLIDDIDLKNLATSLAIGDEKWDQKGWDNLMDQFLNAVHRQRSNLLKKIGAAEASDDHEGLTQLLKEKIAQARKNKSGSYH